MFYVFICQFWLSGKAKTGIWKVTAYEKWKTEDAGPNFAFLRFRLFVCGFSLSGCWYLLVKQFLETMINRTKTTENTVWLLQWAAPPLLLWTNNSCDAVQLPLFQAKHRLCENRVSDFKPWIVARRFPCSARSTSTCGVRWITKMW